MRRSERVAWASFWVATAAFLVSSVVCYFGLQTARQQLTIDQQPMAVVYCSSSPQKTLSPDYIVWLKLQWFRFPVAPTPWFGKYPAPPFTAYTDCLVQNYGKYPLMTLTFVLDVDFWRTNALGTLRPISDQKVHVTIEESKLVTTLPLG